MKLDGVTIYYSQYNLLNLLTGNEFIVFHSIVMLIAQNGSNADTIITTLDELKSQILIQTGIVMSNTDIIGYVGALANKGIIMFFMGDDFIKIFVPYADSKFKIHGGDE